MFHFWYEFHLPPPEGAEEILDEYLWCNRFLIIDNKPVFIKFWNESDIKRISDIIKTNGSLRTKQELAIELGIQRDTMKYSSLISAIPSKWKKCVRESKLISHTSPVDLEITLMFGNSNKMFSVFNLKITIRNLYILNMSVQVHCTNMNKCIIMLTLIGLSYSRFRIR